jgi:hypothetical protein
MTLVEHREREREREREAFKTIIALQSFKEKLSLLLQSVEINARVLTCRLW